MTTRHLLRALRAVVTLATVAALVACSGDPEPTVIDPNQDDPDAGLDVDDNDVDDDVDDDGTYCLPCDGDDECDDGQCLALLEGEQICGQDCTPGDDEDCPDDAYCATVDEDANLGQCIPEAGTCDDLCEDVTCPGDEFCEPTTGTCEPHPRICDTGCTMDIECGDPAEHRCIPTGAPDGETMCTTLCDPDATGEDEDLACPADYVCAALDNAEGQGVCYPLALTCTDRCHDVECPAGHNCDPVTGDCVEAEYGACEADCEIDAECEGPDDMCLNVGIGDAPHCWQACVDEEDCGEGYDCASLLGLTSGLCLPENQQCDACYGVDCFPDGICDPTSGECIPHPEDCTVEGCDDDEICEPTSRRCVGLDQSCSGDSWAVDCDNVVTRCTSQTPGTDGVCATICDDDNDCTGDRSCESTQYGDLCLTPDFGGPSACGVTAPADEDIGQPCEEGEGDCSGGTFCVESGGVPGFCTDHCDDATDCPDGSICGMGPDGDTVCLPAQCRCAGDPQLADDLDDGLATALDELGLTLCDLYIAPESTTSLIDSDELKLASEYLQGHLASPTGTMGLVQGYVDELDSLSFEPAEHLTASLALLGYSWDSPSLLAGSSTDLGDAIADLDETAGGDLDAGDITDDLDDIPEDVADLASELVVAIDDAYSARDDALEDIDDTTLDELFDKTHRLFLGSDTDQDALDLDDSDIADGLADFPLDELAQIASDLAHTIDMAVSDADLDPDDFAEDDFGVVVDTAAGAIIIGDAGDNTYDPDDDSDLDGPSALVLEVGGDNEYRIPVGANQSVDNGVSILVDLDGNDTYSYPEVGDDEDGDDFLTSDDAGRIDPADAGDDGPFSLSETARQGAGRLGIGMVFDYGEGDDTYETLRIGQGAGILGVGAIFDRGDGDASFEAEAFAQGAGFHGVGLIHSAGGDNSYRIWHAGQGFGTAGGVGLVYEEEGNDEFEAVTGTDSDVLYHSPADGGMANQNFAQGAAAGGDEIAAGLGIIRNLAGDNSYDAASYAQGFGEQAGLGMIADADGDDTYDGRSRVQAVGIDAGAGVLLDTGGDDEVNQSTPPQVIGQGSGADLGWGAMLFEGGENEVRSGTPGGGDARDGGFGFSLFDGGPNDHNNVGGGLGRATFDADDDSPQADGYTVGMFLQTGGEDDTYSHPDDDLDAEDNNIWRQDDEDVDHAFGIGVDQ